MVDRSASVAGILSPTNAWGDAIATMREQITELPIDSGQYAVILFGDDVQISEWIQHPDPIGEQDLVDWCGSTDVGSWTHYGQALEALVEVAGTEPTTVVWVSDGQLNDMEGGEFLRRLVEADPLVEVDGRRVRTWHWVVVAVGRPGSEGHTFLRAVADAVDGLLVVR